MATTTEASNGDGHKRQPNGGVVEAKREREREREREMRAKFRCEEAIGATTAS